MSTCPFCGAELECDWPGRTWKCGTYMRPDGSVASRSNECKIRQVEQLQTAYRELAAAVWACPVKELDATHAETVDEAVRDRLRAVAAEAEVARLRAVTTRLQQDSHGNPIVPGDVLEYPPSGIEACVVLGLQPIGDTPREALALVPWSEWSIKVAEAAGGEQ